MAYHSIEDEIRQLKHERNALILAHYYEESEIQDIADHVGDSFFLAQTGQQTTHPVVLVAGVVFMAESVKILSPEKTVLAPDLNAGCSLVDATPADAFLAWRQQHPDAIAVTYVNSSAAVKALSDVICTSSNAEKIIRAIPREREILFAPDRQLGEFLVKQTGRPMHLWPGSCEVHVLFSAQKLALLKQQHPEALVLAHPECTATVLNHANIIGSTSLLLETVIKSPARNFIVATESGILHQMKKHRPDAVIVQAPAEGPCACNDCPYMKLNTLEKIHQALLHLQPAIELPAALMTAARTPLERMLLMAGGNVPPKWLTALPAIPMSQAGAL